MNSGPKNISNQKLNRIYLVPISSVAFLIALAAMISMTANAEENQALNQIQLSVKKLSLNTDSSMNNDQFTFLPITLYSPFKQKALGEVSLISGPYPCEGFECYDLSFSCDQISCSVNATLRVGTPTIPTIKGTILFFTGWTGTYYWGGDGDFSNSPETMLLSEYESLLLASQNNADILKNLRANGFQTVELKWSRNWWEAERGQVEGIANLACRPATALKWVYENIHKSDSSTPYCATGHSNGASQLGYAIAHYGLADILSLALMEGGPNFSRIDQECIYDPMYQSLHGDINCRSSMDLGFGFPSNGTGPCATQDVSYRSQFQRASLAYDFVDLEYPKTMVSFLIGGEDTTTTAAHGLVFHDKLIDAESPFVTLESVPGAPHFVTETPEGAQAMETTLLEECHLR